MVYFPNALPRINPKNFSLWVPCTVVQMVGKVNAQVRNNETGKSSNIHLDRIKELRENLEENEETAGMQQDQQRDRRASHAKENEGKQHEEVQVGRGPAGAGAAVLAQDRDMRDQVEAEQGKKRRVKPKKRKQIEMQAGWLPRMDHAGKKGHGRAQWVYRSTTWTTIGPTRQKKGGGEYGQRKAEEKRRNSETARTTCT
jgi:hypothetical protein